MQKKEESKYSSKKTYVFKYGVIDSKGNLVFDYKFDNIVAIGNKFLYFSVYDFSIDQRKISILNLENNKYVAKDVYGGILKPSWNSDNKNMGNF